MFNRCTSWCESAGSKCLRWELASRPWSRSWAICRNATISKPHTVKGPGSPVVFAGRLGTGGPRLIPGQLCTFTELRDIPQGSELHTKPCTLILTYYYRDIYLYETFTWPHQIEFFLISRSYSWYCFNICVFRMKWVSPDPCLMWPYTSYKGLPNVSNIFSCVYCEICQTHVDS